MRKLEKFTSQTELKTSLLSYCEDTTSDILIRQQEGKNKPPVEVIC